ncbi:unnamed protein product [Rotaria magnacalcarata]|uniref:Uncharacterized protein n=1 Tax=Rotaria magnacalcarata TaxID=392030 RepID=A0A8S3J528_9BILA|nr:unnamed protein product [Rotaria magnacalcarata]CAF5213841.1 unnamed protein product [Rotaria magnacalcarata]
MPIRNSTHKTPWRYRRFWRLFRRKKPSLIDITYPYEYMMRFPRLPITVPPLVPTLMSYRWYVSLFYFSRVECLYSGVSTKLP